MNKIVETLLNQVVGSLGETNIKPTREHEFLACQLCMTLSDLCESGRCIIFKLKNKKHNITNLPNEGRLKLYNSVLKLLFSRDMFKEHKEFGFVPNWKAIESFSKEKRGTAFKIYSLIKRNMTEGKDSKKMQDAIFEKNKQYFVKNFDTLFSKVPFKDELGKFKNMLTTKLISGEDQDLVWEYFAGIADMMIEEEEIIQDIKKL